MLFRSINSYSCNLKVHQKLLVGHTICLVLSWYSHRNIKPLLFKKLSSMLAYFKLIRVKHWVKNLFIFIPLFFAAQVFHFELYARLIPGFFAFSFVASAIYILNDYRDREVDRLHPKKKLRPLASGDANLTVSLILMVFLILGGLTLAWSLNPAFFAVLSTYLVINIAYTYGLKNVAILDIFLVASGFLFRVYSGGILIDVAISHWLAIMIMLLSLFLALAKRRDDLVIGKDGGVLRKSARNYNLVFINSCLTLFAGIIIVAYIMYTVSPEVTERLKTEWLFATTVFVVAGLMRYLQITFVEEDSGSPTTVLLRDKFLIVTLLGWIATFYLIIYTSI